MKKFVCRLLVTCVVVFVISMGLDLYITQKLSHSKARFFSSWNDIIYGDMQCDAVVMGSSRGFIQYDPAGIDSVLGTNCYNLGVDGRCIDAEVIKYKVYREHNPKPKLIIQNVDYGTLKISNGYEREQFLPYLSDDLLYELTKSGEGFSWADKYLPLVRYAGYYRVIEAALGFERRLNHVPLYKGYYACDDHWDGSELDKVQTVEFCRDSEAVAIFDNYLAECKREGIQVILVFAPIYIGATQKVDDVQSVFDFYDSIAAKYDYPILNYTFDSLSYDTAYFYNALHMNRRGSALFSRHLAEDIKCLSSIK